MRVYRFSKTYFNHLFFYYRAHCFVLPVSVIIDKYGIVVALGFWGLCWLWKSNTNEE